MTPHRRDTILLFAILPAVCVLTFTGWVWFEQRALEWSARPWYSVFPPATAALSFAIGALVGWLWTRPERP